jgi:integrase
VAGLLQPEPSGKRREVPMRQVVYDLLAALPESRTGRIWRQRNIRTAFESAVEAAGREDLHFHDLRHHFASWYIMRGRLPAFAPADPRARRPEDDPPLRPPSP